MNEEEEQKIINTFVAIGLALAQKSGEDQFIFESRYPEGVMNIKVELVPDPLPENVIQFPQK